MKIILTEQQVTKNYSDDVLFIKYKLWDNSQAKRKLPFEGVSAWPIYKNDLKKLVDFFDWIKKTHPALGGGSENLEIVNPSGKKIIALDYTVANPYVVGDSDVAPEAIEFNPRRHTLDFEFLERDKDGNLIFKPTKKKYQVLLQ